MSLIAVTFCAGMESGCAHKPIAKAPATSVSTAESDPIIKALIEAGGERVEPQPGELQPPEILEKAQPEYPKAGFIDGKSVSVQVRAYVTEFGECASCEIMRSPDIRFDENAMAAVKKYKFKPATYKGMSCPALLTVEVKFNYYVMRLP